MLFRTGHQGQRHPMSHGIHFVRLGLLSGSLLERNDAGWGFGPLFLLLSKVGGNVASFSKQYAIYPFSFCQNMLK